MTNYLTHSVPQAFQELPDITEIDYKVVAKLRIAGPHRDSGYAVLMTVYHPILERTSTGRLEKCLHMAKHLWANGDNPHGLAVIEMHGDEERFVIGFGGMEGGTGT